MYKLVACLVLASAIGASADACDKPECQDFNVKCVGEGAYCTRDVNSGSFGAGCSIGTRSACYQCGDASLACHHNKCIKKVDFGIACCPPNQGTCDPEVQHSFCLDNLVCANATGFAFPARGTCNRTTTVFLNVGDNCDPNSLTEFCYNGDGNVRCDPTANRCIFVNAATGLTNEGSCYSTADCKPGFYCPGGADVIVGPNSCTPSYPTNSATRGKPCNPANASQCGYIMQCIADNAFETSTNFMTYTCQPPYSRRADEACDSDMECGDNTICTNGWCTPVQGPCLGRQCFSVNDCTNNKGTMTCSCPPTSIGGGYQRCIANSDYQSQWQGKYMWDNYYRSYVQCLADNSCQFDPSNGPNPLLKCSIQNCQSLWDRANNVISGRTCSNTEPLYGRSYPSSASTAAPAAVSLLAIAAAFFAAQRKH